MSRDFGFKKPVVEPAPEQKAAFAAAAEVRPEGLAGGLSLGERASASRAAAVETGFSSREPRPVELGASGTEKRAGDVVSFAKPGRQKVRGTEPLYPLNMRPRVSVVNRFNSLADELRLSNPELLELLLEVYDHEKPGRERA